MWTGVSSPCTPCPLLPGRAHVCAPGALWCWFGSDGLDVRPSRHPLCSTHVFYFILSVSTVQPLWTLSVRGVNSPEPFSHQHTFFRRDSLLVLRSKGSLTSPWADTVPKVPAVPAVGAPLRVALCGSCLGHQDLRPQDRWSLTAGPRRRLYSDSTLGRVDLRLPRSPPGHVSGGTVGGTVPDVVPGTG